MTKCHIIIMQQYEPFSLRINCPFTPYGFICVKEESMRVRVVICNHITVAHLGNDLLNRMFAYKKGNEENLKNNQKSKNTHSNNRHDVLPSRANVSKVSPMLLNRRRHHHHHHHHHCPQRRKWGVRATHAADARCLLLVLLWVEWLSPLIISTQENNYNE